MKKAIQLLFCLAISLVTIQACNNQPSKTLTEDSIARIEVLELETYKSQLAAEKRDHYFVDVRTPEEVAAGQIPGAINIDYKNANFKEKIMELDPSKPMYLYCRSGNRSGKASPLLVAHGFTEIYDLKGGWKAYSAKQ